MADIPVKAIPKDHPHRREFARWEREFQEAMERALNKWRRELFRDIDGDNVRDILARLDDRDIQNVIRDAAAAAFLDVAMHGVDKAREQVEREVFGVS
jgi:type II secretory pathway component PulM